jgi:hypothetical protein
MMMMADMRDQVVMAQMDVHMAKTMIVASPVKKIPTSAYSFAISFNYEYRPE